MIVEKVMFHFKAFPLLVNVRWKIQFEDEHASPSPCIRPIPKLVCNHFWNLKVTHHALVMNGCVCFCAPNVKCQSLCHIAYMNLKSFLVITFNNVSLHLN